MAYVESKGSIRSFVVLLQNHWMLQNIMAFEKPVIIGLDKSGYQVYIFLISPQKHMLWVLIRSASPRRF